MQTTLDWDLNKMMSAAYAPMFNSRERYLAFKGSRGSGKSKAAARKVIYDIMTLPYVNWLVLRRYANTNRQSTYTDIQQAAHVMGVAHLFKFNGSLPEITYKPTGQKIIFRGLDKPLSITSISVETGALCRMWCEEAYQFESEESWETVDESMRGKIMGYPNTFYQTIFTFNPWNENHWLKPTFFDVETRLNHTVALTTTYKDNPFLDDAYIERLEDMIKRNPRRAEVAVFGNWGISEGLVFEGLFEQRDVSAQEIANLPKTVGLDFGMKHDPTAGIFMAIDKPNLTVYVFDEFYKQAMLTQPIAQELMNHKAIGLPIVADSAEPRLITELSQVFQIPNIKPAGKGKDSVTQGVQFMQSYHFVISSKAQGLLSEMNTYVYDKDKLGNWLNKPVDANNHAIDALRYAMEPFMFQQNGQYMNYQERVTALKNLGL